MTAWRTGRGVGWWQTVMSVVMLAGGLYGCASGPREPDPDAFITGVAFARERIYVPPGAVFDATLLDVSRLDGPPVALGRQRINPAGTAPFAMHIPYHSARVMPQGRYAVRAQLSVDGRLLFVTDMIHPVLQDPAYRRVDVVLARVQPLSATVHAEIPLMQTYWKLVGIDGEPVATASESAADAHLMLLPDESRVTGSGGCNRFLGEYALNGGRLQFASLIATLRLCLDGGTDESRYLQALRTIRGYAQQGRELVLKGDDGKSLLRFEAVELGVQPPVEEDVPMLPQ